MICVETFHQILGGENLGVAEHLNSHKAISDHHYTVTTGISWCGYFYTDAIISKVVELERKELVQFESKFVLLIFIFKPVMIEIETGSARSLQPGLPVQKVPTPEVRSMSGQSIRKLSGSVNLLITTDHELDIWTAMIFITLVHRMKDCWSFW